MRAKFIGKRCGTGYERDYIFLEYEYRGRRYEVYENRAKGNEPLSWQHKSEQSRIDQIIDLSNRTQNGEPAEEGLDLFFKSVGL